MFKDNFSRYEFKFPMTYRDIDSLIGELLEYVEPDEHVGPSGIYTISSLYMDNDRLQCYYETINNDYFRQKVRLRVYGAHNGPDSQSFLEVKSKIDGLVVKRRIKMRLADAMDFCDKCVTKGYDFDAGQFKSTNPQILEEVRRVIVSKELHFVNCVSYDRIPYFCSADPDLRITFDCNIRTRGDDLDLTHGTYGERRIPEEVAVLEVKTSKDIPYWLVKILGTYGYRNQTFSKYCSHFAPQKVMLSDAASGNIHAAGGNSPAADNGKTDNNGEIPDNNTVSDKKGEYKYVSRVLDLTY